MKLKHIIIASLSIAFCNLTSFADAPFIRLTKASLTERYSEKVVTIPGEPAEPGEPKNAPTYEKRETRKLTAVASGKFFTFDAEDQIKPVIVDISTFTGDTEFAVSVGDYQASGKLGDDPKFIAGKSKKVSFIISIPDPKDEAGLKILKVGMLTLSWTPKTFSAVLLSKSPELNAKINDFVGIGETPGKAVKFSSTTDISIRIGESEGFKPLLVKGSSKYTERKVGRGEGAETFALNSASLVGVRDTKAPVLKTVIPKTVSDRFLDLRVLLSDNSGQGLLAFDVSVNGREGNEAYESTNERGRDEDGNTIIDIIGLILDPGANTVIFRAFDDSGNVSTVKKTITVLDF